MNTKTYLLIAATYLATHVFIPNLYAAYKSYEEEKDLEELIHHEETEELIHHEKTRQDHQTGEELIIKGVRVSTLLGKDVITKTLLKTFFDQLEKRQGAKKTYFLGYLKQFLTYKKEKNTVAYVKTIFETKKFKLLSMLPIIKPTGANLLSISIELNDEPLFDFLLKQGIDPNQLHSFGFPPSFLAAELNRHNMLARLLEKTTAQSLNYQSYKGSLLLIGVLSQDTGIVKMILEQSGVLLDLGNKENVTPLMAACSRNNAAIVKLLLKHGTDTNKKDKHDRTAIFCAAFTGHDQYIPMLTQHSAQVYVRDMFQQTPLMLAADQGHIKTCKTLMRYCEKGNKIKLLNAKYKHDITDITVKVAKGNIRTVLWFLKAGSVLDKQGVSDVLNRLDRSQSHVQLMKSLSSLSQSPSKLCTACQKEIKRKSKQCKNCELAWYCSRKCQKIDWKNRHSKKVLVHKDSHLPAKPSEAQVAGIVDVQKPLQTIDIYGVTFIHTEQEAIQNVTDESLKNNNYTVATLCTALIALASTPCQQS